MLVIFDVLVLLDFVFCAQMAALIRVLYKIEYIEHVEKNVLVLWAQSYNELDVTIFLNIALVVNNALDFTLFQRCSSDRLRSDSNVDDL